MRCRSGLLWAGLLVAGCGGGAKKAADAPGVVDVITQVKVVSETVATADGGAPPNVKREPELERPTEADPTTGEEMDVALDENVETAHGESASPHQPQKVGHSTASTDVGRIDAENLSNVIAESRGQFSPCLERDSSVLIDATISTSGEVLEARAPQSIPDDPKLRDCVVSVFRRLKLAPLKASAPTRVSFELSLKRPATY